MDTDIFLINFPFFSRRNYYFEELMIKNSLIWDNERKFLQSHFNYNVLVVGGNGK